MQQLSISEKLKALQLLKTIIGKETFGGLCTAIDDLHKRGLITYSARVYLGSIIPESRNQINSLYCWKPYDKAPRIEFLETEIGKLKGSKQGE